MFTVIIPTRDRPVLLERAVRSVARQEHADYELLLIDGSATASVRDENAAMLARLVPRGVALQLPEAERGGPGATRNYGLARATRPYVAFLDDDDEWIDAGYLSKAAAVIERLGLDLHFADQEAVRADGSIVPRPVWAEDLAGKLFDAGVAPDGETFVLSPEQVLMSDGFAHLNTTIVRRRFAWEQLGGFDREIEYEEDRDFYLRAIDAARVIGYTPHLAARHYVPAARASASSIPAERRDGFRLQVLSKAVETARHAAIRARCRRDRGYALRRMSMREAAAGQLPAAIRHGRAALRDQYGTKWLLFLAGLYARSAVSRRSQAA